VILIGELRDAETAETALKAAESGHLVFSTLHTIDAAETIGRMIEFFPAEKQDQIRSILAASARRRQPAAAAAHRGRPRRRGRGDDHELAHRRPDPRAQGPRRSRTRSRRASSSTCRPSPRR
jgi:type II secretory ATPase GspE/PulE/Tfp pilus assembly ATPase PilB-like protein